MVTANKAQVPCTYMQFRVPRQVFAGNYKIITLLDRKYLVFPCNTFCTENNNKITHNNLLPANDTQVLGTCALFAGHVIKCYPLIIKRNIINLPLQYISSSQLLGVKQKLRILGKQ